MEGSPSKPKTNGKADLGKRIPAALIDGLLVFIVGIIPLIGGLVGAAYMLLRDGLDLEFMDHRSIGKKLMKLRPVAVDGGTVDINTSIRRNWMFILIPLSQAIGSSYILLGWRLMWSLRGFRMLLIWAGAIIGIIEIVLLITDVQGRRWGDKLAGTKVIEVEN